MSSSSNDQLNKQFPKSLKGLPERANLGGSVLSGIERGQRSGRTDRAEFPVE